MSGTAAAASVAGSASWTPVAAAGIGAVGNIFTQRSANKAALKRQREQNEMNMKMWQMTNEYNSPVAQMERLKQAGLNPHLVYGSSANTGNASSIPEYQSFAPQYDFEAPLRSLMSSIAAVQDMRQRDVTRDLTLQQIAQVEAETEVKRQVAALDQLKQAGQSLDNQFKSKSLQYRIDQELYGARQAQQNWLHGLIKMKKTSKEIDAIDNTISLNNARMALMSSQRSLMQQTFGFNEFMNPLLLEAQKIKNSLGRQTFGFNQLMNPKLLKQQDIQNDILRGKRFQIRADNRLYWPRLQKEMSLLDTQLGMSQANLVGKNIQNYFDQTGLRGSSIFSDIARFGANLFPHVSERIYNLIFPKKAYYSNPYYWTY